MRMHLTVRGTLHVEHIGGGSLFRRSKWVMWLWPIWSLESITSISSVACQPLVYGILYMVELVSCLIIPRFLAFLELVNGFRSVDGIFVSDMSAKSAFCSIFVCPFISMYTNVMWYPEENDTIIFGKSVHFVKESLWWEELMNFCSVRLEELIWSLSGW